MAANDIMIRQRNAANAAFEERQIADPGADAVLKFNNTTNLPELTPVSTLFANAGAVTATSIATGTLSASGAALFSDGTASAPSIGWTSDADGTGTGLYRATTNSVGWAFNGSERWRNDSANITWGSGVGVGWSANATTSSTTRDLTLRRGAAASLVIGKDDSATPVANTVTIGESSRAGTDTNVAGANGTIASGTGTGTGTASSLIFQTPTTTGSGSGAQTLATRLTLSSAGAIFTPSVTSGAHFNASASGWFQWAGQGGWSSLANGVAKLANASDTAGISWDVTTDGTAKLRNRTNGADGALTAGAGTFSGPVKLGGYTVATLPAGVVGQHAYVTDATAPTYLGALVGGGAVTCPVFYNGTAWVSH